VYAQLSITSNKDKAYITNKLLFEYDKSPNSSLLTTNRKMVQQNLLQKSASLSNEFDIIKTKGKADVVELYSYLSYLNKPEVLQIAPGLNEVVFNNNLAYKQLLQTANVPTYFTNTYISFRHPLKNVLSAYKIGFSSQNQQLQTNTQVLQTNNRSKNVGDSFSNNLNWQYQKIYAEANYDFVFERIKLSVSLPMKWQQINYSNSSFKTNGNINFSQFAVTPSTNIKYATGIENYITASYNYSNDCGTVEDAYHGYILKNFNQLSSNNIPIKQNEAHSANLGFNFRKTIKIFFFNINANYTSASYNAISQNELSNNLQQQTFIPFNNTVNSYSLSSGVSKYLFNWHSTVSVKASIKQTDWNQLQNGSLLNYNNVNTNIGGGISPKINQWLNAAYNFGYTTSTSKADITNAQKQVVDQVYQATEITIMPGNNLFIKLKGEQFYINQKLTNNQNNYFFMDATLRYKLNKIKADILFDILNIADTRQYSVINLSANNLSENIYSIRPRQFLVKLLFNF
jgi:hypothetical protein